ncbi:MAG: AraC family transcriptional regulator [Acidobacteria bacterium]|nr:AraC family transcriptional regulator [Acidobacteriota bacterium]
MSPAEQATDRIYTRPPHFSVHLRAGRRLRLAGGAAADYAALLLVDGRLRWRAARAGNEATTAAVEGAAATSKASGGAVKGRAMSAVSPESGELAAGGALLAAPGDELNAAGGGAHAEYVLVRLSPVFVADCAARAGLSRTEMVVSFRAREVRGDERLARLARDLADELREEAAGQGLVVSALVEQALVHLLRRYANLRRSAHLELSRAGLVDRRIRLAVELMHAHLNRDLSLEEIAAAAYLSPFHFARLFKKLTGATPHAYLASLRAARAQQLLAETDLPVTEVGARVGYMSSSHFARAFRQATGISPRAYRKALVRG